MPRVASVHVCSDCGHESARWAGQCPGCGEWNTLVEEVRAAPTARRGAGAGAAGGGRARGAVAPVAVAPVALGAVAAEDQRRLSTGIGELDVVLGGGLVPGSLVLIGGAPGIGKSTLTTMALANLVAAGRRTLYVSAEESAAQIRLRAERLSEAAALGIPVIAETELETVCATLERERPEVCVIDSVQTLHAAELTGAPGSVGQVREVAGAVMRVAKELGIAVMLVGHVTKDGALAGPRVLEHLVDCVLQFEGERERTYRTVRAVKNRFGSTNEAAVFEMRDDGLVEVLDASARFVAEATRAPGSVVLCSMEGSRPLLVEVQALVARSELVPPRRVVSGLDRNRVALVLAVLGRHGGIGLGASDVFVNVVGGVKVEEPGVDLAVALAVASAARGVALKAAGDARGVALKAAGDARGVALKAAGDARGVALKAAGDARGVALSAAGDARGVALTAAGDVPLACFGELGLTGELRTVAHPDRRLREAAKFGLVQVIEPASCPTLRAALAAALGGRRAAGAA